MIEKIIFSEGMKIQKLISLSILSTRMGKIILGKIIYRRKIQFSNLIKPKILNCQVVPRYIFPKATAE